MSTQLQGRRGEIRAAEELRRRGYEILAHSYRCRFGEIDLIARKKNLVAFVEVKLRKDKDFMPAWQAVTAAKRERIRLTASHWMAGHGGDWQYRFDIIEVYTNTGEINIYENAFQ